MENKTSEGIQIPLRELIEQKEGPKKVYFIRTSTSVRLPVRPGKPRPRAGMLTDPVLAIKQEESRVDGYQSWQSITKMCLRAVRPDGKRWTEPEGTVFGAPTSNARKTPL